MPRTVPLLLLLLLCLPQTAWAQDADALLEQFDTAFTAAQAADEAKDFAAALPQWQQAFEALDHFEETEEIVPFMETVLFKLGETNRLLGRAEQDPAKVEALYTEADRFFAELLDRAVLAVYTRDEILLQRGFLESDRGKRHFAASAFQAAREAQSRALEHFSGLEDAQRRDEVQARERSALALSLKALGDYAGALKLQEQALQYWAQTQDTAELRREMNALAATKLAMGRIVEAAADLETLLESLGEQPDPVRAGATFNLAVCRQLLGEYRSARQDLERAEALAVADGDLPLQETIVNSRGILDYALGFYAEALELFARAAQSADTQLEAKALLNTAAVVIASLKESYDPQLFERGETAATEAMSLATRLEDPRTGLAAGHNLARLQYEKARVPAVAGLDQAGQTALLSQALLQLGRVLTMAQQLEAKGARSYELSDIAATIGAVFLLADEAGLTGLESGGLCPQGSPLDCGAAHYRLALDNAATLQAMEQLWKAETGLARVVRRQGLLDEAAEHYRRAIEIIEGLRSILGADQSPAFLRNRSEPYTEYIDLLLEQWRQAPPGSPQALLSARTALEYLERSRLAALKALFEQALPQERQEQGRALAETEYRLARLRLDPEADQASIKALEAEQVTLLAAVREGDALLQPPRVDLDAVQAALRPGQAVLAYYYNSKDLFVWRLDGQGLQLASTPRWTGAGIRARDFLQFPVARFGEVMGQGDVSGLLADAHETLFNKTGLDLSGVQSLYLLPYGRLGILPFGAMITDRQSGRLLLEDYQISYLAALGQLLQAPLVGHTDLLAVGNPVMPGYFGTELPLKVAEAGASGTRGQVPDLSVLPYDEARFLYRLLNPADYAATVPRGEATRAFSFTQLAEAGTEAREIGREYQERGLGQSQVAADAPVSETELLRQIQATPQGYVHLATHGKLLPASPLDSFLVFSEDPTAPEGMRSGLVTVRQLRGALFGKLAGARLCTLSCCETALRGDTLGLELASLAGAFLSAGVRVVVASLWEVPSEATAVLMQRFYSELFSGKTVPEALRTAQLSLAREPQYAAPLYWAAFIPLGLDPAEVVTP